MSLSRPSGGASYLKPADHINDIAVLVEPKRVDDNVENNYQGTVSYRDVATADVTCFRTSEDIQNGVPSKILKGVKMTQKALVGECRDKIGEPFVAVIRKVPMGAGSGYVFRGNEAEVPDNVFGVVNTYLDNRNAEVAQNLADAPGFDD